MKEITVSELKKLKDENADFHLFDIREMYEYEVVNIGGELFPMGDVMDQLDRIPKNKMVIMHCKSGNRSNTVVSVLSDMGFSNIYSLKGGIMAWIEEINPSLPVY